jgi:hypothetical protein
MSKRPTGSSAGDPGKPGPNSKDNAVSTSKSPIAETKTAPATLSPRASLWKSLSRRRLPWLLAVVCLVGIVGIVIEKYQNAHRMGIIEYMSDDPDAQLVLEKDGQQFPLKKGTKYTIPFEPGNYKKIRLVEGDKNLKFTTFLNLDPGGRGIVKVERVAEATKK